MNKIHLCVLPLALVLAAYSGQSAAQEIVCDKGPVKWPKCEGVSHAPMVTLNLEAMKANPHCIRVHPGAIIVFRLTPKNDLNRDTVEILPKDSFDAWLQGKNKDYEDLIIIKVPGEHEADEEGADERRLTVHNYSVNAPGKCLDPRVEVEH